MTETCETCHKDYVVTPKTAKLALFISYPPANHVVARCTSCGATEIIYVTANVIMKLMVRNEYAIVLGDEPTEERRNRADRTWLAARPVVEPELPLPPRAWVVQLHDDMRTYGGQS